MPLPKTVTAQDFIKAIPDKAITALEFEEFAHVTVELRMLFARARQEARREALKEMDEAWESRYSKPRLLQDIEKLRAEYLDQP